MSYIKNERFFKKYFRESCPIRKIVVSLHRETLQKLEKYDEYDRRIAETP